MTEERQNRRTQSFFWMIVRGFLLVFGFAGLFVIGTGISTYVDSRNRFLEQNQSQLDTLSSTLTMQIHMAFEDGIAFFQEPETIIYHKPENQRSPMDHSELWRIVGLICRSESTLSPLVMNEFSFYKGDENVAAGAGTYEKEFFFSQICRYEEYDSDFWESNFTVPGRYVLPETAVHGKSGNKRVLPLVTVLKRFGSLAFYVSNISIDYLDQIIKSSNAYLDQYYIYDENQNLLIKSRGAEKEDILNADYQDDMHKEKGFVVFRSRDDLSGWTFYGLLTGKNYLSVFRHILSLGILLVLLMFSGEIIIIFYLSHRVYNPIKDMKSILPGSKYPQKRDEIDYIKEGIKELVVKDSVHRKKEKTLERNSYIQSLILLLNGIDMPERVGSIGRFLSEEFHFSHSSFVCATIMIQEVRANRKMDRDTLLDNISYEGGFIVIPLSQHLFEVIYSVSGNLDTLDEIEESLNPLQDYPPVAKGDIRVSIGIGAAVTPLEKIALSHKQASTALPLLWKESPFSVRCYEDLPPNRKVSFSFYDQKGILNNIETGREGLLESFLSTLIEKNEKQGIESDQMAELYRQILFIGRRVLEEHGMKTDEIALYGYIYDELVDAPDILSLRILSVQVIECLLEIQKLCCSGDGNVSGGRVEDIRDFVEKHYGEPLSLDSIADHFNITPKYLSRIFKESSGIKLSDFLSLTRIEKAKELLSNSNCRIGEIANQVGIDNHATFLRLFHKYEGVSPKDYRNCNLQKQEILQ